MQTSKRAIEGSTSSCSLFSVQKCKTLAERLVSRGIGSGYDDGTSTNQEATRISQDPPTVFATFLDEAKAGPAYRLDQCPVCTLLELRTAEGCTANRVSDRQNSLARRQHVQKVSATASWHHALRVHCLSLHNRTSPSENLRAMSSTQQTFSDCCVTGNIHSGKSTRLIHPRNLPTDTSCFLLPVTRHTKRHRRGHRWMQQCVDCV